MESGVQQSNSNNSGAIKSSYSADSLSRSYFERSASNGGFEAKSFTPDSMASERASAESPDMKMMKSEAGSATSASGMDPISAAAAAGSFSQQQAALQAYYSQSMAAGLGGSAAAAGSGVMPQSGQPNGSLPPLLPMAAQLSQYAGAAAAGSSYPQTTAASAAGEYRRPLQVLF